MAFDSSKSSQLGVVEHVLGRLPSEDLDLIVELVLQSGSLKGLAESYGVSYPTIRSRLDRVIERLKGAINGKEPDPMTDLLAGLLARGEVSPGAARAIRDLDRERRDGAARAGKGEGEAS